MFLSYLYSSSKRIEEEPSLFFSLLRMDDDAPSQNRTVCVSLLAIRPVAGKKRNNFIGAGP